MGSIGRAVGGIFGGGDRGPDPGQLAQQQSQLNRISQFTPFGNVVFGGGQFNPRVDVSQSPEAARLSQLLIPGAFNIAEQFSGQPFDRGRFERSVTDRALGLLEPELERQETSLRTRLAASGNPLATSGAESPGAGQALGRFGEQRRELELKAALEGVRLGGQEQQLQSLLPLQQLQALQGIVPQLGRPPGVPGTPATDIIGPQLAQNQRQQQQQSDLFGGLFGLGSAFLCWVAEELYGEYSIKTWRIRVWLIPKNNLFTRLYRTHGKTWARWVRKSRTVRFAARMIWDRIYKAAKYG